MDRQIVEYHPDQWRIGIMDIDQLAHADGEVLIGAPVGDLDLAPRAVGVEEDEQVDRAVAAIFAVVAFELTGDGGDRLAGFARERGRALLRAPARPAAIAGL